MENCKTIQNDFISYSEGELDSERNAQVKLHLAECEECAGLMKHLNKSFQHINFERFEVVSESFYMGLEEKINQKKPTRIKSLMYQWMSYAAVIAIGLLAGNTIVGKLTNKLDPIKPSISSDEFYWNEMAQEPIESFLMNENLY